MPLLPFASSEALVSRASSHVDEFERELDRFRDTNSYTRFTKANGKGGFFIVFKVTKDPPTLLSAIAFDVINGLRSALDHAVFDASRELGGHPKPKYTKFPFGKTKADAQNDLPRKRAEVPEAIRPHLLSYKPYMRGNRALWALNELRNSKIHRTLTGFGHASTSFGFGIAPGASFGIVGRMSLTTVHRWDSRKNELTVMEVKEIRETYNVNINFTPDVAFSQSTPIGLKPASAQLREFLAIVSGIVASTKDETIRLKANIRRG